MTIDLTRQSLWAGRYRLEPLAETDVAELYGLFADPAVVEYMDISPLGSIAEAREIVDWARELARTGRGVRWSIRRDGMGPILGTVGFNSVERERGQRGEVAYDLARTHWGQGVMSEILPHVIAFGFLKLKLRRLEAMVTVGNSRSCTLLERHGFQLEGHLRDHAYWKGRFWDQYVYGRLAD